MGKGGKGGKKKSRGKKMRDTSKALNYKEDNQAYGYIINLLGDSRVKLRYYHNKRIYESIGIIRGKMKKRVWIARGDVVLVALREFQDKKVDIIDKYSQNHVHQLLKEKEFPSNLINGKEVNDNNSKKETIINTNDDDEDIYGFEFDYGFDTTNKVIEKPKKQEENKSDFNFDEI